VGLFQEGIFGRNCFLYLDACCFYLWHHFDQMKNDCIPPNPHPVNPPADFPQPRKESLQDEVKRLKDEVERLRKFNDEAMAHIAKEERKARMIREGLEAEVERLRKAGDAMAERLNIGFTEVPWKYGPKWYAWHSKAEASVQAWNAAKEGKQP
jgi:hypothetical protein